MRKRSKNPSKLDENSRNELRWSYSAASGFQVDEPRNVTQMSFANYVSASSSHVVQDNEELVVKKSRAATAPKHRLINLTLLGDECVSSIGTLRLEFDDDISEALTAYRKPYLALKFDPADPARTLVFRISTSSNATSCGYYKCYAKWNDVFDYVDGKCYNSDDLLIDLAGAGRLVGCFIRFSDAKTVVVTVKLLEVDEHFITTGDLLPTKNDLSVAFLMRYFHGIPMLFEPTVHGMQPKLDTPSDWAKLFALIKGRVNSDASNYSDAVVRETIENSLLTTKLRPYQMEALQWLVWREKSTVNAESFHSVYQRIFSVVPMSNENAVFFNKISCRPCLNLPFETNMPTGGILADEMGLGKTIEMLALILCNPRSADDISNVPTSEPNENPIDSITAPNRHFSCICGDMLKSTENVICSDCCSVQHANCVGWTESLSKVYRCPYCILNYGTINSRATLVVTPMTICAQWADEIAHHVRLSSDSLVCPLKVFTYPGIKNSGLYVQPHILADNDIVLVSYETLRGELANANLQFEDRSTSLRTAKRFMAVPSPLPAICWWRLCLDEAQMVETPNSAAQMVQRLPSVHRWCVSGTPLVHSINDLLGLLTFLRVPIFSAKLYWNQLIAKPYFDSNYEPLVGLLKNIFWRTSKSTVLDQIGVPPVTESVTYLTFSPVEEHLYRYRYNASKLQLAVAELCHLDRDTLLRHLDRRIVDRFLDPMTPLRRACSDLGRRTNIGLQHNAAKTSLTMTMDQVLADLVHRAVTVCTDYHRQYICSLNGLAGLHMIENQLAQAAECYRQVLWSARDNSEFCETDKLQLIHATHNLHDVIQLAKASGKNSVPEAPSDAELPQKEAALVDAYVGKLQGRVNDSKEAVLRAQDAINKLDVDFYDDWWAEVCERMLQRLSDDERSEFFHRLHNNLLDTCAGSLTLTSTTNAHSFMLSVSRRLDTLANLRQRWADSVLGHLSKSAPNDLSLQLSLCSCNSLNGASQKQNTRPELCSFCRTMKNCVEYEKALFSARKTPANVNGSDGDNTGDVWAWSESETERSLKFLLSFAKRNVRRFETSPGTDVNELFEMGDKHMERFQSLKNEFRSMRQLWMSLKDRVGAEIELHMASNRLQLIQDNEEQRTTESLAKTKKVDASVGTAYVSASEVSYLLETNKNDADFAKSNFDKACGQLRYLRSLEKTVVSSASNEETCPVCMTQLGQSWAVLPCAHCACLNCATTLGSMMLQNRRLPCPVCRHTFERHELAYVSLRPVDEIFPEETIAVSGSYSTKIMAVVKIIKVILKRDRNAKFLVFSSWIDVLTTLAHALAENSVSAIVLQKGATRRKVGVLGEPSSDKFTSAIRRFRSTDESVSCKVLLLPYLSGSNGLNLVEANHVILCDPCLNNATDVQAIARVYRMGQTRPTTVHRLLVRSTIEERIYSALLKKRRHPKGLHHDLPDDIEAQQTTDITIDDSDDYMDAVVGDLVDLYRSELLQGLKSSSSSSSSSNNNNNNNGQTVEIA